MDSLYSWEGHELNFEPRIWDLLGWIADELYDGSRSKAANSIILFAALHLANERAKGKNPVHWLTRPAMKDGEQLESLLLALEKIRSTGAAEELGAWWEHEIERRQGGEA